MLRPSSSRIRLCLHVDDGLLVMNRAHAKEIQKSVNDRFAIKEWTDLEKVSETVLGVKTTYSTAPSLTT